jgi:hypothetical protein
MSDLLKRLHILAEEAGIENLPIAETLGQAASRIRELEGEVATWQERADLLAAEINAGRADLDAALADNECLRVALKRISDTPSKMIWGESSEVLEAMHAMEALADAALKGETNGN